MNYKRPLKVNNSTKDERYHYINELYHCHNGDCDNCGICIIFKGKDPLIVYKDYIEGFKEFEEIII